MVFIISIVKADDIANNYIYDNANIIRNSQNLNNDIQQIYDKNSGAKIIIYTYTNDTEAKTKYLTNFDEFNLQDNNMNILIAYKPDGNLNLFFPKQCGLNKANIQDIITQDNSGFIKDLSNKDYDMGFMLLISELGDEIDIETTINGMVCQASEALAKRDEELFNEQHRQEVFDLYGILEISDSDITRINQYNSIIIKANEKYPAVSTNLIKSIIEKESNGVKNRESTTHDLGLMQISPCVAKQYNLIPYVTCEQCKEQPCTACTKYCSLNIYPTSNPNYKNIILNPTTNIMVGTKLLNNLLEKCTDKDFMLSLARRYQKILKKLGAPINEEITDTDIIRCAVASYHSGQGTVGNAAGTADSLSFNDYVVSMSLEQQDYVRKVIGYYSYLEKNYPSG
jgi:soluble lytic murein transglycosylase-like protein